MRIQLVSAGAVLAGPLPRLNDSRRREACPYAVKRAEAWLAALAGRWEEAESPMLRYDVRVEDAPPVTAMVVHNVGPVWEAGARIGGAWPTSPASNASRPGRRWPSSSMRSSTLSRWTSRPAGRWISAGAGRKRRVALDMAVWNRRPSGVHHSDRGARCTSLAFSRRLEAAEILGFMGSVGDALDNAVAENFYHVPSQ